MHIFFPASFERKDCSYCPPIGLAYEPIAYCSSCQIWLVMRYNTLLSDLSTSRFFTEDRCLNRCNISFAISRIEDCLELNFKYADYQTLAHLFYSSCVSVRPTRAQRFLSVWVSTMTFVLIAWDFTAHRHWGMWMTPSFWLFTEPFVNRQD